MKSKLIKDFCEPSKIKFMAMLNDYLEPTSILTPLVLTRIFCILSKRHISHRAMAPPLI